MKSKRYSIIDKKTNKVLYENLTVSEIAKELYLSPSAVREHYKDRNTNRFFNCKWRIEDEH